MEESERYITLDGLGFHYTVSGTGKDLVLMHGWGCSIAIWQKFTPLLAQWFRVWVVDFPGFGGSEAPKEVWGIEEYTRNFESFCRTTGISNPILIGHSFGGRVAIVYSSRNAVNKVILVDAAGVKPHHSLSYYAKVYRFKTMKHLLPLVYGRKRADEMLEKRRSKTGSADYRALTGVMRATFVRLVNEDLCRYMPLIKAPTLLIWGSADTATPLSDGRRINKLIPDSGLVVFEGAPHYSFLTEPARFMRIIENFLDKDKTLNA